MTDIKHKKHYAVIDLVRGFAILLMFIYHFSYDLDYFGFIQTNFASGKFWINFRILIVTLFLTVMGISLYLASYQTLNKKRFAHRLLLLIVYSLLVSISSWVMFPKAMILFGILHFIAVASVLGLLFVQLSKCNLGKRNSGKINLGILNLMLGLIIIVMGQTLEYPVFNQPFLQWIGMMTKLPVTVDYVPIFPWFGIVLIGIYLGQLIAQRPADAFLLNWTSHHPLTKLMTLGGRHSLHIYMLHQPLFMGILYIISLIAG
ncbi:MAG: DUF1624 domain-containing protein [Gammaproteobacteria bacterium]|nr:DUF1624 domain-containing protein [Gammaproteobacteria bacterium]